MELVSRMFSAASADDQKAGRQAARLVCLPGEEAKEAPKHTPPSHDTATRTQSHLKRHPTVSTTRAHSSRKRHSHVLASETCISERIVHPSLALPYDAALKHRQHCDSASPPLHLTIPAHSVSCTSSSSLCFCKTRTAPATHLPGSPLPSLAKFCTIKKERLERKATDKFSSRWNNSALPSRL